VFKYRDFYEKFYRTFYFTSPTPREAFFKGEQYKRAKKFIEVIRSTGIENNIKRVFDVGAGEGGLIAALQGLMGYEVAGCELNPNYVEWVQKEKSLDISLGTLDELSIEESSYDAVILCHVLEHVKDPSKEVKSIVRIIRPGGI
jgi:2-polyprenyl-3-methyl-5-hydroxy-6-metoxy-1,4-benzoquinol methylase